MAEHEDRNEQENGPQPEESPKGSASEVASNYFTQLVALFKDPDDYFSDSYHGNKLFGLINLGVLLVAVVLAGFVQRASYGSLDFGDFGGGLKSALALAVPLAALLFAYPWYAKREGNELSLDFMIEKLGGAVALPALLILVGMLLNLVDIRIHSWFHGAGTALIYIAAFVLAYRYVAPNRLAVATIAFIAFYFLYRLVGLIL